MDGMKKLQLKKSRFSVYILVRYRSCIVGEN